MGSVIKAKTLFVAPLATYPPALLLMAAYGWWADNLEAVFAAPITALFFTLLNYPVAVLVLWVISRTATSHSGLFQITASIVLALVAYFAFFWQFAFFHFPVMFMAIIVGVSALSWATLYVIQRAKR